MPQKDHKSPQNNAPSGKLRANLGHQKKLLVHRTKLHVNTTLDMNARVQLDTRRAKKDGTEEIPSPTSTSILMNVKLTRPIER